MQTDTQKIGNQFLSEEVVGEIKSPTYTIVHLKKFDLSKIPVYFKVADFERVKSDHQIMKIKSSIANNRFYNIIISVIKVDADWKVIDGQHRLAALYLLYRDYGLRTYDLVVIEYPPDAQREVYRKNNVGIRLSIAGHIKALDTHTADFFNDLRDILCHDEGSRFWSFKEALDCHYFATTGMRALGVPALERALESITKMDIDFIRTFRNALVNESPTKTRGVIFKPTFMKACYRAAYENKLNVAEIGNLMTAGIHNCEIMDRLDIHTNGNYQEVAKVFETLVKPL